MPCILKIKVHSARDLPVMDRKSELTDAYVEVRFADYDVQRTSICRKTLNPVWNADFRVEVTDDGDLQNEPLELKVLDYDTITANDAVGSVLIDLNPLLLWGSPRQIAGWFPIYDTLRGVRGEIYVQVKIQFFGDVNPFKDSSAGVQFFSVSTVTEKFPIVAMFGFVDALLCEDDPEYHWSDSFRTPRSSNESRQRLLYRMSGQLRRLLGRKVLELGGNAVLGFQQSFDYESEENTITARAIGTAVRLAGIDSTTSPMERIYTNIGQNEIFTEPLPLSDVEDENEDTGGADLPDIAGVPINNGHGNLVASDSKKGNDLEDPSSFKHTARSITERSRKSSFNTIKTLDQQIFTLQDFPSGAILRMGGVVAARSVKLIENDRTDAREAWWDELRDEIKSHAKVLGCPHVIGYSESITINDDLCVLSAVGTAAIIDLSIFYPLAGIQPSGLINEDSSVNPMFLPRSYSSSLKERFFYESTFKRKRRRKEPEECRMCHIPYSVHNSPFPTKLVRCAGCKKKYVSEILLSTTELPPELDVMGKGCYVEAHVCRTKKNKDGESNASIVSDAIPFVEYDIHRELMNKLKIHCMNAIFGLRLKITVGDSLIVAVASGTACYLSALPMPPSLQISRNLEVIDEEDRNLLEIQKRILEIGEKNRESKELALEQRAKNPETREHPNPSSNGNEDSDSDSDSSSSSEFDDYDTRHSNLVIQIDDDADEDFMAVLFDPEMPENFEMSSTEYLPNSALLSRDQPSTLNTTVKTVTLMKQVSIGGAPDHLNRQLAGVFRRLYEEIRFRLILYPSWVVAGIRFDIQLPKPFELQIIFVATVIAESFELLSPKLAGKVGALSLEQASASAAEVDAEPQLMFNMDDESQQLPSEPADKPNQSKLSLNSAEPGSDFGTTRYPYLTGSVGNEPPLPPPKIEMTPLSYIPNTTVERYLGKISLHFVKEAHVVYDTVTGGKAAFVHTFMTEVQALARAHVAALGGNAIVALRIDQTAFEESLKNQGYGLISISGDVVELKYDNSHLTPRDV
ncbi:hypothetical protein K493DRAFT_384143 [Basidiobolus meristosporus CBS 931.73]|uniref:C2 domain-containing protein n=1 Tax=Basidiobolus meristosporus CBS 931.73 TaxID=1314790 RepID=A0A1Y1XT91_9FUNG|nr:hypothetical protein K493DRAFT_384143 [Basidiobolus meristosporus CBS 931.73]|eukprot:ORX88915.1 hypothetical protein K493DRAFT_384143 [Basidiobolus meristosporus CBS 931.73]